MCKVSSVSVWTIFIGIPFLFSSRILYISLLMISVLFANIAVSSQKSIVFLGKVLVKSGKVKKWQWEVENELRIMAKNVFIFAAKKQKIKRNRNEKDFYCIFAALAMMACSDTDMSFLNSSQTSQMKSSYNAVSALNKTLRFFQKNEDKLMYMKVRGYRWSDLKWRGLSRELYSSSWRH